MKVNVNRRDKFTIHSKAVVCQDVELKGDITIGSGNKDSIPDFYETHRDMAPRDYRPPKSYHFRHCGAYRNWKWLYHRGGCYHRESVRNSSLKCPEHSLVLYFQAERGYARR